jgi:hypothetical protein
MLPAHPPRTPGGYRIRLDREPRADLPGRGRETLDHATLGPDFAIINDDRHADFVIARNDLAEPACASCEQEHRTQHGSPTCA